MDRDNVYSFLSSLFKGCASSIANDLCEAPFQKTFTTKCGRREKALAYILEAVTFDLFGGDEPRYSSLEWMNDFLEITQTIKSGARSDEAKVALERVEKRLLWAISRGKPIGSRQCVACSDWYTGSDHKCTNSAAQSKDIAMTQDKDIL